MMKPKQTLFALTAVALALSGCASFDINQSVSTANQVTAEFGNGKLELARSLAQRQAMQARAESLLQKPLNQRDAVELAMTNSPALQALLAQSWANGAGAAQSARIANPIFSFERIRSGDELEIGRMLGFGLLDLLTLPRRASIAMQRIEQVQLQLATQTIEHVTEVRQAWVRAVAAEQMLVYAQQVNDIAEASAELARRMQTVGNFNKLQRARQQAFYADSATQLATATHATTVAKEALIRILGLTDEQAKKLTVPDRLPELPAKPRDGSEVGALASKERLDIGIAKLALNATAKAQGLNYVTSFTDIELAARKDTVFDHSSRSTSRGFEIELRLPIFDWGGLQRETMSAQMLVASNQLEATTRAAGSHLRESYSAYRTTYDIAKHYRDEIVPLRKIINDENILRYNGMIIGVFELLADSRDQVSSVIAAINAQQQFWLADAALLASIVGKPMAIPVAAMQAGSSSSSAGH
jgi:outer membrane protein TolC